MQRLFVFIMSIFLLPLTVAAQELPRCTLRPTFNVLPRTRPGICLEVLVPTPATATLPYTALATDEQGNLYAARPLAGQVWLLEDRDGDALPETPRLLLTGLDTPNSLLYTDGALYIAGGSALYRWQDGALTTLVADLPAATGFWNGGLVRLGDRLIVGVGADCTFCTPMPDTRGLLLSFALDGSDRQVIARGLRQPSALAVENDTLYVSDAFGDQLRLDTIHRVLLDVAETTPVYALPAASAPVALLPYTGAAFPQLQNQMLLVLAGEALVLNPVGFQLVAVERFGAADAVFHELLPADTRSMDADYERPYNQQQPFGLYRSDVYNRNGEGLYPNSPLGIALSPEGWIYLSVSDGTIYVLRPS